MANLTITIDDDLLRRARVRAAELGTSVNAVLREYMRVWAGADDERAAAVASLLRRSRRSRSTRGARRWTRDELHERQRLR
jgi:plasmid stability protein